MEPPKSRIKRTSSRKQVYSSPDKIKVKRGYRPTNCGEPKDEISCLTSRDAYRAASDYIDGDPYNNCCTAEEDGESVKLYLWKATELPVKLTKGTSSTVFLYFKELKYLKGAHDP